MTKHFPEECRELSMPLSLKDSFHIERQKFNEQHFSNHSSLKKLFILKNSHNSSRIYLEKSLFCNLFKNHL